MTKCDLTTNTMDLIEYYAKVYIEYLKYINSFKPIETTQNYLDIAPKLEYLKEVIISKLRQKETPSNSIQLDELFNDTIDGSLKKLGLKEFIGVIDISHQHDFYNLAVSLLLKDFVSSIRNIEINNKSINSAMIALSSLTIFTSFDEPDILDYKYFESLGVNYNEESDIKLYLYQTLTLLSFLDDELSKSFMRTSASSYINTLLDQLKSGGLKSTILLMNVLNKLSTDISLIAENNKKYALIDTDKK